MKSPVFYVKRGFSVGFLYQYYSDVPCKLFRKREYKRCMKPGVRNTDTSDFYIIYIPKFRRNSSKSVGHQGYFVYYQNEHTEKQTIWIWNLLL